MLGVEKAGVSASKIIAQAEDSDFSASMGNLIFGQCTQLRHMFRIPRPLHGVYKSLYLSIYKGWKIKLVECYESHFIKCLSHGNQSLRWEFFSPLYVQFLFDWITTLIIAQVPSHHTMSHYEMLVIILWITPAWSDSTLSSVSHMPAYDGGSEQKLKLCANSNRIDSVWLHVLGAVTNTNLF